MGRAAGNSSHYTWRLWNESTGRYETDCEIKLVSVTSVINAVLAKPQLVGWAYRYTRDAIAGTVAELRPEPGEESELLDMLSDGDWLEEYLKENKLRPDDAKYEAAQRGTRVHKYLETLAGLDFTEALAQANKDANHRDPYIRSVAQWWQTVAPHVVAAEQKLWSLKYQFQGTTDLIWYDYQGQLHCTDLKTRKAGADVYDSDLIQGGAYKIAYEEMYDQEVDVVDVLLARDDGNFLFSDPSPYAPDVFLDLLSVYNALNPKGVN